MTTLLTHAGTRGSDSEAFRVRGSAYGVVTECLRQQADARRQSRLARLFGADPLTPGARDWYRDALGEVRAAKLLKSLPAGFTLLHAVPTGDAAELSQIVIGPTGVFAISIKNHSGHRIVVADDALTVNGRRTNHLREARFEAARTSKLLDPKASGQVTVIPLIAIVDPRSLAFGRTRPGDIVIVPSPRLVRTITRRRAVVPDAGIADLIAVAQFSGNWYPDSKVIDETLRHEARFARLVHQVDAASRRRALWLLGSGLAVLAAVGLAVVLS